MTTGWPGNVIGRVGISSCSFANVIADPANETRTDEHRERDREPGPRRLRVRQLEQGDEGGGTAADAVEQRDQLRHLGHLDQA